MITFSSASFLWRECFSISGGDSSPLDYKCDRLGRVNQGERARLAGEVVGGPSPGGSAQGVCGDMSKDGVTASLLPWKDIPVAFSVGLLVWFDPTCAGIAPGGVSEYGINGVFV